MPSIAILGSQWGDEGKGKIVDLFMSVGDIVARYQGGNNAGHTIYRNEEKFVLHLLPSGILSKDKISILGNGMVINLDDLITEIDSIEARGISIKGRLFISPKAHIVLKIFQEIDNISDKGAGFDKIGTTHKGIGLSYAFKAMRKGIRIGDLFQDEDILKEKLNSLLKISDTLRSLYGYSSGYDIDDVYNKLMKFRKYLSPFVIDTSAYIIDSLSKGKKIIIEGSQGSLLDIDHGTYPFVTSSSCISGGIPGGLGISPKMIDIIIGTAKAYSTRVGNGPFPTEQNNDHGDYLRKTGGEYGSTTGRPRRCGWLDILLLKYSVRLNGFDCIALTKADVLSGLDKIPVCIGYKYKGSEMFDIDWTPNLLEKAIPMYKELDGWKEDISSIIEYDRLPQKFIDYISFIEDRIEVPAVIISTGPQRKSTIIRENKYFDISRSNFL